MLVELRYERVSTGNACSISTGVCLPVSVSVCVCDWVKMKKKREEKRVSDLNALFIELKLTESQAI